MQDNLFVTSDNDHAGPAADPLFLYVIQAKETHYIKIGFTQDVERRLADLQPGCPHELQVLCLILCENAPAVERLLHKHFAASHIRGEWFALPEHVPQALDWFAYIVRYATRWRHSRQGDSRPKAAPPRGPLTQEILKFFSQHETLTVAKLRTLLHEPGSRSMLKVQLHRLVRAGVLTRIALGVYSASPHKQWHDADISA